MSIPQPPERPLAPSEPSRVPPIHPDPTHEPDPGPGEVPPVHPDPNRPYPPAQPDPTVPYPPIR